MVDQSNLLNLRKSRQGGKPLVLIVDDNPAQRKLFEIISEEIEIAPYIASSCEEAVEAVSEFCFDVIFMDVKMTGADGFECTKYIRKIDEKKNQNTPIVAVTANAMIGDKERCLASGMTDYLPKPFSMSEFKEKLDRWAKRNRRAG